MISGILDNEATVKRVKDARSGGTPSDSERTIESVPEEMAIVRELAAALNTLPTDRIAIGKLMARLEHLDSTKPQQEKVPLLRVWPSIPAVQDNVQVANPLVDERTQIATDRQMSEAKMVHADLVVATSQSELPLPRSDVLPQVILYPSQAADLPPVDILSTRSMPPQTSPLDSPSPLAQLQVTNRKLIWAALFAISQGLLFFAGYEVRRRQERSETFAPSVLSAP